MKTIRNLTAIDQPIVYEGEQYVLAGRASTTYEDDIADEFLEQCDGLVEHVIDDVGGIFEQADKQEFVWLANMTGDPDAVKTFKRVRRNVSTKQIEEIEVPNPKAEARDISREFDLGMHEYNTQDGLMADNLGKELSKIPAFQRRQFPKHIANWHLNRDSNAGLLSPQHKGAIIVSRAKSNFEPDMTWGLDDMRCYLRMIDPRAELGQNEKQVTAGVEGGNERAVKRAVNDAKVLCMKRLHFRLADPKIRLYGKVEFEKFRAGFESVPAEVSPDVAAAIVNKSLKQTSARAR